MKSRSEQEQLEEEIKDVRDQNSKLQIQVNKSSVEAVDEAQKKQKEAEKKMEQAETKARNEKKRAELEIRKAKKEVKARTEKMRDTEYFWGMGYITVILFAIIQNGAFQNDFIDFFRIPFMWYFRFCEWLAYPTYDNGFNPENSIYMWRSMGYQNSGNRSCPSYIGNYDSNNYGSNKTIQKNVG